MKLVIDMPEEQYNIIKSDLYNTFTAEMKRWGLGAIRNGTPLPKGHGKIGDLDKLKQKIEMGDDDIMEEDWYKLYDNVISNIDNAYAIIEADNTESEENG